MELLAINYAFDNFNLFILNKKEFTIRTDREAIVKFYATLNKNKRTSRRRWLNFQDRLINKGFKVNFEHIQGKDNTTANILSRLALSRDPEYDLNYFNLSDAKATC
jgi:hypothetical protein